MGGENWFQKLPLCYHEQLNILSFQKNGIKNRIKKHQINNIDYEETDALWTQSMMSLLNCSFPWSWKKKQFKTT